MGVSWCSTSTGPPCLREPAAAAGGGEGGHASQQVPLPACGQTKTQPQCHCSKRSSARPPARLACPPPHQQQPAPFAAPLTVGVPRRPLQQHLRDGPAQACQHGGCHDQQEADQVKLGLPIHQQQQASGDDRHNRRQAPAERAADRSRQGRVGRAGQAGRMQLCSECRIRRRGASATAAFPTPRLPAHSSAAGAPHPPPAHSSAAGAPPLQQQQLAHQLGFSMPQAMAKTRRKRGVVDLHMT